MREWMRRAAWVLAAAMLVGAGYVAQLGLAEPRREVEIRLDDAGCGASGAGVEIDGGTVAIRAAGVYRVRGALSEGQLLVKADKRSDVTLILDGAEIANASEAAILVENADLVTIRLAEGTENLVRSGAPTEIAAGAADPDASGGAIHAKDDLAIEGPGKLTVRGYVNNGIHCSNRLTVSGGEIEVEAVNNGVKGKDGVAVSGGALTVRSGGDGIESDAEGGAISIEGGAVAVESFGDGLQAAAELTVSGGELRVTSGGGSAAAEPKAEAGPGRRERDWDRDEEPNAPSAKGLKAGERLVVSGGSVTVDAADDALHSDGDAEISGGALNLTSGDDAVHADDQLTVSDGALRVATSYEGLEANRVLLSGGDIDVTASDDGVNANGGEGNFGGRGFGGMRGMGGPGGFRGGAPFGMEPPEAPAGEEAPASEPLPELRITGGRLHVDAEGDGLDSNGDLRVSGGEVVVDGPSRSGNGALDSGSEGGGTCLVDGGTVLAIGASGMAEGFDAASAQPSLRCDFDGAIPAGSEIVVADADGNALFSHVAAKGFSSVVFSCPALQSGATYAVTAGDARAEVRAGDF